MIAWFSRLRNIYVTGETVERIHFAFQYLILSLTNEYIHGGPLGSTQEKIPEWIVSTYFCYLMYLFFVSCPKLYFDNMALVLLVADYHPSSTSNGRLQHCRSLIAASHKRLSRARWVLCSGYTAKVTLLNFISEEEQRQFMEESYNHQTVRTWCHINIPVNKFMLSK